MRFLFLSWRDLKHPQAGGAEDFTHQMIRRLAQRGHQVIHFSCGFQDALEHENIDQVHYVRGSRNPFKVIWEARKYYRQNRPFDWVIDQRNSHHFFTSLWLPPRQKRALLIHQTTRELWYSQASWFWAPFGHLQEMITLRQTRHYPTITVSNSTREELIRDFRYDPEKVEVFSEGLSASPPPRSSLPKKEDEPTFIYVGRFARYKGVDAAIEAFAMFYKRYQKGKMYVVGKSNSEFEQKIYPKLEAQYPFIKDRVKRTGFVSENKRNELMARSHAILVPSQREGWGLIIPEANAQNTPAIVYPSPGLRDAVDGGRTGLITQEKTPQSLCAEMIRLWEDKKLREDLTQKARAWAKTFTWDKTGEQAEAFFEKST